LGRPCRIYAPVGTHETLLAYLVRRLLENGANTSFINRIADPKVSLDDLIASPVEAVRKIAQDEGMPGLPHPKIPLPRALFGDLRANSFGLDLTDEGDLARLVDALAGGATTRWLARPTVSGAERGEPVINPADPADIVGEVVAANDGDVERALQAAHAAAVRWQDTEPAERAASLERAADLMEARMTLLMGLIVREAGKTFSNAIAEVREAVDFLRYYARQARSHLSNEHHRALGPVVCISPWNFPLAIFTGQVSAALAAGNPVLAKPAEQTPLIAAEAIRILHAAGVPTDVVQLVPGMGETVGAKLVADARVQGVVFTGSTDVARIIQRSLAKRARADGRTVPLVAETGGQNAMIVDSSALTEQVVADACVSAFDSAGQRCSALRVLCLQEEIADRVIEMLEGAMAELAIGVPDRLAVDVGPVIDAAALKMLTQHIDVMRARGHRVYQTSPSPLGSGTFVPPTLIHIDRLDELEHEVFGPVLHVLRYPRDGLDKLVDGINALGYGLTLGIHSRIDETIESILQRARVGNVYVNRNIVGAVVGVQPFGGEGLSGTGPKAGGPLYIYSLLSRCPADAAAAEMRGIGEPASEAAGVERRTLLAPFEYLRRWARGGGAGEEGPALASLCDRLATLSPAGVAVELPGPTGERNSYAVLPREAVLCLSGDEQDRLAQLALVLALGSRCVWQSSTEANDLAARLPDALRARIDVVEDWAARDVHFDAVLHHGSESERRDIAARLARRDGPIVNLHGFAPGETATPIERLLIERVVSVNTAAAGGNASLMTVG
jgi:RHH-type proline utilization regulon transcriptional repressor/proline dehydrogenase/delta 1-pyrroline-5-carboxylate dehydrogenase